MFKTNTIIYALLAVLLTISILVPSCTKKTTPTTTSVTTTASNTSLASPTPPAPTPTIQPTQTASPTLTPTPEPTQTATTAATPTPEPSQTATPTPTPTPEPSQTATPAATPTPEPTQTATPTPTPTPEPTQTATPTPTPTPMPPVLSGITPLSGQAGTSLTVTISGSHLTGTLLSGVNLGDEITASQVNLDGAGSTLTAVINIGAAAVAGSRNLSVTTPAGVATLPNAFTVNAAGGGGGGFIGGGGGDTTPPTVVSVSPLNSAVNVAVITSVVAVFSESLNPATITADSFTLKQGSTPVAGTSTYDPAAKSITFKPAADLTFGLVYNASLTTAIKDSAGNALAAAYNWSFSSAALPHVDIVTPQAGALNVAVNATVSALFSKSLNSATLTADNFTLKAGVQNIPGSIIYNSQDHSVTFTPSARLASNTVYTVTLTAGIADTLGYHLPDIYNWSFTTGISSTSVSISAPATVAVGASFIAEIQIDNVNDLTAYQLQISFDNTTLQLVDSSQFPGGVEEGKIGVVIFPNSGSENTPGSIRVLSYISPNTAQGQGYLARLHFKALKAGTVNLTFSNETRFSNSIFDSLGLVIPADWSNGSVTIH